jgi:rare lipoprotein A
VSRQFSTIFLSKKAAFFAVLAALSLFVSACGGGHKQAKVQVPAPPPIQEPPPQTKPQPKTLPPSTEAKTETKPPIIQPPSTQAEEEEEKVEEAKEAAAVPPDAKPLFEETGMASWYGAPFHNLKTSNGETYNMHAFTAAHRTLPLGTIIRVTNVKTGNSAIVRITDRGPFIKGRILDLSFAAAKKVDVWRAGVSKVRLEVLKAPTPLDSGGRWAVQIGGFGEHEPAIEVADQLTRRYHTAKVLCYNSPAGDWWVRIRVKDDDRQRAEEVAHTTQTTEGSIFLVRLD